MGFALLVTVAFLGTPNIVMSQSVPDRTVTVLPVPTDPCRTEVAKFERGIGFIRQSSGNEFAARIKESLLPAKTEADILMREGYCGLAKYLRENKLLDKVR